nr:MAG TPA: major capsid protein [Caudoviricetes sp.]
MPISNRQVIQNAEITTDTVSYGLLNPEQARKFIQQTFEATTLRPLIRHDIRTAKTGEVDKIGIASRLLRSKVENTDDGYRANPKFDRIQYATTAVRIPWEITEETLRENIEGQGFEGIVTNLMTTQMGVDLEDLDLNGDTATESTDPDYDFLKINDGWIKQISNGGHVVDRSTVNSGAMSLDVFYSTVKAMPNKYNNGKLRWIMSPHRYQDWIYTLLNSAVSNGGIITDKRIEDPAAIPVVQCAGMPDDKIILTDPKNLIEVATYGVQIRKTTEGKEAIMQDKRFYVVHFDFDPIIEELDATAIITGLAAI